MSDDPVRYEARGDVAVLRHDDGRANVFSPTSVAAIQQQLDRVEKEASAVVWVGRPGRFSAGFDLETMRTGPEPLRDLVMAGAELFLRMLEFPKPIVAACTGHAIAAGAIALMSSDTRIGTRGDFKIGLNEVAIGMTLPIFGSEIARQRLSKRHFLRATSQGELYSPEGAVDAGFLDRLTDADSLLDEAIAAAESLGALPQPAFRHTKLHAHAHVVGTIRETLADDVTRLAGLR